MDNKEIRIFDFKLRTAKKDGKEQIVGYAAVFNKLSEDLGGFRERIKPGTFSKTIQESDIRALFNHDPNYVLGRNKAGTLRLKENSKGLKIRIDPPDWASNIMESIHRGDIDQMSFGFRTIKDSWSKEDGQNIRQLEEVQLFDICPVTYPAYPDTTVAVRELRAFGTGSVSRNPTQINIGLEKKKLELLEIE